MPIESYINFRLKDSEIEEELFWSETERSRGGGMDVAYGSFVNDASDDYLPSTRIASATREYDANNCFKMGHLDVEMESRLLSPFGDEKCDSTKEKKSNGDLNLSFNTPADLSFSQLEPGSRLWKTEPPTRNIPNLLNSPSQRKLPSMKSSTWKGASFGSQGSSQSSAGNLPQIVQSNSLTGYSNLSLTDSTASGILDFGSAQGSQPETGRGSRLTDTLTGDPRWSGEMCVERQAQAYRTAASAATAAAVWSGLLPPRNTKGSAFSCKVFLGGVPWDITEADLQIAFGKFGNPKIEWPAAHDQSNRNVKGHLYLIFDTEKSVKQLLGSCNYDFVQGHHNWYYKVASKRMRVKEVQVIPWQLADASYVRNGCMTTFGTKTVFVGSLHGMLTAEGLAKVLDDLFGGVVAATIDTDKYKYPIGSGRVTFNSTDSYMKALRAVFVDLRTPKFNKKIQIDPFLEDSACSICGSQIGPYFCRDLECFSYFCHACWQWQHSANNNGHHIPLMRNPRV